MGSRRLQRTSPALRHRPPSGREDLAEQAREFAPFGVLAAAAHAEREGFERLQGFDLCLQLHDGAGRGRLVENARRGVFRLLFRRVVELRDVVRVELRSRERNGGGMLAAALEPFELAQAALQPLAPPVQRLVDRLGRRGEPPLEKRQREADRARPLGVGECLGAVELLAHVVGDGRVETGFRVGKPVRHCVGDALGKECEAVPVEQGEEELEVLFLAVVRRRRSGAGGFELVVGQDLERKLESAVQLVLPLLGKLPGQTIRHRSRSPRATSSLISSPAMMVLPAPGSSASRKRNG